MADRGAGQQRSLYLTGNSWVVAVPPRVRKHLRVKGGRPVYWHLTGPREATITPGPARVGGKPPGLDLADELAAARREISRLKARVRARPTRVYHEGTSAGFSTAQRIGFAFDERLITIAADLAAIRAELGMRPPGSRPRANRPGPPRRPPGGAPAAPDAPPRRPSRPQGTALDVAFSLPDDMPSSSAPPSAESSGGDAASGEERPQAAHE